MRFATFSVWLNRFVLCFEFFAIFECERNSVVLIHLECGARTPQRSNSVEGRTLWSPTSQPAGQCCRQDSADSLCGGQDTVESDSVEGRARQSQNGKMSKKICFKEIIMEKPFDINTVSRIIVFEINTYMGGGGVSLNPKILTLTCAFTGESKFQKLCSYSNRVPIWLVFFA